MASGTEIKAKVREGEELAQELRKIVRGEVRFDDFSKVLYSTDASIYQMEPIGVVIPRDRDDVIAVMETASRYSVPILPRCGGTSLAGQAVNHAIVLDFSKYMDRLLEVNAEESWARVEPGIVLDQLNRSLGPYGLQYAPDPTTSNRACVGGSIGNNTCGAHSVIYGKTLDHVLELSTVLSDGSQAHLRSIDSQELEGKLSGESLESEIYRQVQRIALDQRNEIEQRYPKVFRRVSGYNLDEFVRAESFNLARMVVGSEGTLCVVTEAKVNLVPRPKFKGLAVLHFYHLVEACEATWGVLKHDPAVVEVIDKMILDRCRNSLGFASRMTFVEGDPGALLLVEVYGDSENEVAGRLNEFKADVERRGLGYACVTMTDQKNQDNVWAIRRAGLGLLMSVRGDAKPIPFVEDTAVDPSRLGEYVRRFDEIVQAHGTIAGYYGHASVGCLHIRPLVNLKDSDGIDRMLSIASDIADLVMEFGGSLSGEHGDGIVRGVWTEKMFGPKLYQAFREVKQAFDPKGIMNPGKIIDCPPMTENLRYGPSYRAAPPVTSLDFSADHGYDGMVDMCNGMGTCRKQDGAMCPSYMATKEEEHSTRGRANLLRAVLSGKLPQHSMASRRLYQALDLCLECKACKSECSSGVDMAKLKYEFLERYHRDHGLPLRARLFANINTLNRLGQRMALLANWGMGSRLFRWMLHRFLGIHKDRRLPALARVSFPAWFSSRENGTTGTKGKVVLFNDTFMNYNYPSVGMAAVELLERAGFTVVLANAKCCARPMISKGLLSKAKDNARYNVDLLYPYVENGFSIVGCEPSCLLTLRDEYPDLLRDDMARKVAENSYLIDEFLVNLHNSGKLDLEWNDTDKKVLFHGHCHQRALVGTKSSLDALNLPSSFLVEEVDAGCCGMAGAFGYEKEHFDISMVIGQQRLFPAVEAKEEDWEVAVMGVSCRQQIEHGTGRKARHLVEVLRDALS